MKKNFDLKIIETKFEKIGIFNVIKILKKENIKYLINF